MIYSTTANTTLLSVISSQPILHSYKLSRYSQYCIIWSILLQPILHCCAHYVTAITTLLYSISFSQSSIAIIYHYNQYYLAIIYAVQPILHCYDPSRYSQYHIAMISLVTANPNMLQFISLQPIIHSYDLPRTANTTLMCSISLPLLLRYYTLSRYSQYQIAMIYLVTTNTTLLGSIPLQPILHSYNLSRHSQYYIAVLPHVIAITTLL